MGDDDAEWCTTVAACVAITVICYVFYGFYIVTDVFLVTIKRS